MPSWKRTRPKIRKYLGKHSPQIDIVDEWDEMDIDRAEQKAGIKRREKRWKELKLELAIQKKAEKVAIDNVEKMGNARNPTPIELAWLRCDYVLSNIMEVRGYKLMEILRIRDPETYKKMYKIFISKNMMENIQGFVDYFDAGGKVKRIKVKDIYMEYKKIKGIRSRIIVKHKGGKDREL